MLCAFLLSSMFAAACCQMGWNVTDIYFDDCSEPEIVFSSQGLVRFHSGTARNVRNRTVFCEVVMTVSAGLQMHVLLSSEFYCADTTVIVWEAIGGRWEIFCNDRYLSITNQVHILLDILKEPSRQVSFLLLSVRFLEAGSGAVTLRQIVHSPTLGILQSAVISSDTRIINLAYKFHLPEGQSVMISFPHLTAASESYYGKNHLKRGIFLLYELKSPEYNRIVWSRSGKLILVVPQVFNNSLLFRYQDIFLYGGYHFNVTIKYSLHALNATPAKLSNDRWNCSVPLYHTFSWHLHCNLRRECDDGKDEGAHCPYSSAACNGSVAAGRQCYVFQYTVLPLTWHQAGELCEQQGMRLVSLSTQDKYQALVNMARLSGIQWRSWLGSRWVPSNYQRNLYINVWHWLDQTMLYGRNVSFWGEQIGDFENCLYFHNIKSITFKGADCNANLTVVTPVCEYDISERNSQDRVELLPSVVQVSAPFTGDINETLIRCQAGHFIQDFESCDPQGDCQPMQSHDLCQTADVTVRMFQCEDGSHVHYSAVCDWRKHCTDSSDEYWCVHDTACTGYTCRNSQCIAAGLLCNMVQDCLDGSDEIICQKPITLVVDFVTQPPPALIRFDGLGNITYLPLVYDHYYLVCPGTHFECPQSYCLPVFVRCNGIYDCPFHQDEVGCHQYMCPGYYRCQGSKVCLHPDHVCDGKHQCPQQDDERWCRSNTSCPAGCLCQGLAFVCRTSFPPQPQSEIRYLDASHSSLSPAHLADHPYLVELHLVACGLTTFTRTAVHLPNLRMLDLTHNQLTLVHVHEFRTLTNLKALYLSYNPIVKVVSSGVPFSLRSLSHLDLSFTDVRLFGSDMLKPFPSVTSLNLSYMPVMAISSEGLSGLLQLRTLDMTDSPMTTFPFYMLKNLSSLTWISAGNHKMCCSSVLPSQFDQENCLTPMKAVLSCENLVMSDIYRYLLWLQAVICIVTNSLCVGLRYYQHKRRKFSAYYTFLSSLHVANFLTGVHLSITVIADQVFRGQFLWRQNMWKQNRVCHISGFLAVLSTKVSTFLVCLMTVDRLLVARFPYSEQLRFGLGSCVASLILAWLLAGFIAAVPLLPAARHWRFYSVHDQCVPLPVTSQAFPGHGYSVAVRAALDFVLFFPVALSQAVVRWNVSHHFVSQKNSLCENMLRTLHFLPLSLPNVLSWGAVAFTALLPSLGYAVPAEMNLALGLVVVPLTASLNPLLCFLGTLRGRKRKRMEEKLLAWYQTKMLAKHKSKEGPFASAMSTSKALSVLKDSIDREGLTVETIEQWLRA